MTILSENGEETATHAPSAVDPPREPIPPFRAIFEAYAPFVWRVLRRLGVREAEVADVSQETFLVLHRKLPSFEGRSSLRTFVYGVAVRVAADHRKRAWVRREQATDEIPERAPLASSGAEGAVDAKRALITLDRALADLDDDRREVFVLYELEELTLAEIAQITGAPLSTLHSRLAVAREHVRTRLLPRAPVTAEVRRLA